MKQRQTHRQTDTSRVEMVLKLWNCTSKNNLPENISRLYIYIYIYIYINCIAHALIKRNQFLMKSKLSSERKFSFYNLATYTNNADSIMYFLLYGSTSLQFSKQIYEYVAVQYIYRESFFIHVYNLISIRELL